MGQDIIFLRIIRDILSLGDLGKGISSLIKVKVTSSTLDSVHVLRALKGSNVDPHASALLHLSSLLHAQASLKHASPFSAAE